MTSNSYFIGLAHVLLRSLQQTGFCSQAIYSLSKQKGNPMKKLILASAISAAFVGSFAQAEEAAVPEHVISYNVGVTSDYVFRGISQSRNRPAFSGGVDYSHTPTGLYAGTWVSTISWIDDSYPASSVTNSSSRPRTPYEQDFYAGIKIGDVDRHNVAFGDFQDQLPAVQ
jgi:uncharacterized protein (TIGR02001 family)